MSEKRTAQESLKAAAFQLIFNLITLYLVAFLLKVYTPLESFLELGAVSLLLAGLNNYRERLRQEQEEKFREVTSTMVGFDKRVDLLEVRVIEQNSANDLRWREFHDQRSQILSLSARILYLEMFLPKQEPTS